MTKLKKCTRPPPTGKTRCINHFLINKSWYLVDLPGYGCVLCGWRGAVAAAELDCGARTSRKQPKPHHQKTHNKKNKTSYAKTAKTQRHAFDVFTKSYFLQRGSLATVLLLVDASVPPQKLDLAYAAWLADHGLPFALVFTKADKRKKRDGGGASANVAAFKRALLDAKGFSLLPPSVVTSAEQGLGRTELLRYVNQLRELWEREPASRRMKVRGTTRAGGGGGGGGGAAGSGPSAQQQQQQQSAGGDGGGGGDDDDDAEYFDDVEDEEAEEEEEEEEEKDSPRNWHMPR